MKGSSVNMMTKMFFFFSTSSFSTCYFAIMDYVYISLISFIFLFLENYGVRKLEAFFGVLIATMAITFAIMFGEAAPSPEELIYGNKL